MPHPSDDVVNIRVQTTGDIPATQALRDAIMGAAHACGHPSLALSLPSRSALQRPNPTPSMLARADLASVCDHVRETFSDAVAQERAKKGEPEASRMDTT